MTTPSAERLHDLVRRYDRARRAIDEDDFESAGRWLAVPPEQPEDDGAPQVLLARALMANQELTASLERALERTRDDLARVRRGRRLLSKLPVQDQDQTP